MTANLSRAQTRRRSQQLRPIAYRVEVDVSESVDVSAATFPTRTILTLSSSCDRVELDFLGEGVDVVCVDGVARPVVYDGATLVLESVPTERVVEIDVRARARYSRTGQGMHRYQDPVDGRIYLYTHYEPADARRVFADLEQPDLKVPFTFVVTGPRDWQVVSNAPVAATRPAPPNSAQMPCDTREFEPTAPMSTYLTCICAGPYRRWERQWSGRCRDGTPVKVPLGLLCRESLAPHFDADALFTVTEQGLDFFHDAFDFPYPWGKYDSIFVPEYNLGAMENPGLVTFSDAGYVFTAPATRSQYEGRANTVLHEMAHMWFGDLVTPQWWDDLWLKESFADYMGTFANAAATEFTDAWTPFCARRKAWAYLQDQLPTTHPIVADIPDVEAAKQNFDGITYAKGASVLKQLVAYVGQEAFFAGARQYFRRHAFGCATLPDLLGALEESSGRDLRQWSRTWLQTAGVSTLTPVLTCADDDTITRLEVRQDAVDPIRGGPVPRAHRLVVGLYSVAGDTLSRTDRFELDVVGPVTPVTDALGLRRPDLILVNDDDLTYAKVRLDDASYACVREHLTGIESSLTRACVWSALWNACRDAMLPAADYIDIVRRQAPRETHIALLDGIVSNAASAIENYTPVTQRPAMRRGLLELAFRHVHDEPGSGAQLTWARLIARLTGVCDEHAAQVRALLEGTTHVEGLVLGSPLRWRMWTSLAATGHADRSDLDAELAGDDTSLAPVHHLEAISALPDAATKAAVWEAVLRETDASNAEVTARVDGFSHAGHADLLEPYVPRYFEVLLDVWSGRSQEIAERIVLGAFPHALTLRPTQDPHDHAVVRATHSWLAAHPDAPGGLRRLVLEQGDHAERALRAQAAALR